MRAARSTTARSPMPPGSAASMCRPCPATGCRARRRRGSSSASAIPRPSAFRRRCGALPRSWRRPSVAVAKNFEFDAGARRSTGLGENEMIDENGLAQRLMREHEEQVRFRPFAAASGIASLEDAYRVQDRYVSLLQTRFGDGIGYKIGLTSQRMQTMCGIDQPIAGVVLADRLHHSGAKVAI